MSSINEQVVTSEADSKAEAKKKLRLLPGVILVSIQWLLRFVVPSFAEEPSIVMGSIMGSLIFGLGVLLWWAFFSRAAIIERLIGVGLIIAALFVAPTILHESITGGMMGFMFGMYAIPAMCLALVAWAVATRDWTGNVRLTSMVGAIALAALVFGVLRTDGIEGDGTSQFAWRWSETSEAKLLDQVSGDVDTAPMATAITMDVAWPGYRGPNRDGIVRSANIATDWQASPPKELWRRSVGPAWSSFAVQGDVFYTQEQRGDDEIVACYRLSDGEPIWMHRNNVRFYESNAGAGPRGTPTLYGGNVYAFGATGLLDALDASDGTRIWSRDVSKDADKNVPMWGFSSSPLVVDSVVIIAAVGKLMGYDLAGGELLWSGPRGGHGYSSPHLFKLDGVQQVLQLSSTGAVSLSAKDGAVLWQYDWPGGGRICQPAVAPNGDLLIAEGETRSLRRVSVQNNGGNWQIEEKWTTNRLKPYFNDFVVHEGNIYGFDGRILTCVDLETGDRKWKGGRYGHGQMVLLANQDLLVVLAEKGDIALVSATDDKFSELGRVPAIKSKTWNHPVLVDDVLLVRNGEEMAAFKL